MSEIKLNLVDSHSTYVGTIHGSIGDYCVAALSAEPETVAELESALTRFHKDPPSLNFPIFACRDEIDDEPYDAGILVIDLAARIVASDSTYSCPDGAGQVEYHDGTQATEIPVFYFLPDDWVFLRSIEEYEGMASERRTQRLANPPIDYRAILFGRPLLEFLAINLRHVDSLTTEPDMEEEISTVTKIHAQWLLTPRDDLRGKSPRDVLIEKQDFLCRDMQSRAMQWSLLLEGPPCLSTDSFAYRFAGFGVHEWVIYYDLIRHLLSEGQPTADDDFESVVTRLQLLMNSWLNDPNDQLSGRIASVVIQNERKRLPEAMGGRSMVVDEDCPICKAMGDECEAGLDICFWHLDGSHMDQHFAFSTCETEKQFLEEILEMELFHQEFDRRWKEREERIARGEAVDTDPLFDLPALTDSVQVTVPDPEPPEA